MDARADEITDDMKLAASEVIRNFIEPEKDKIVPETLDKELAMEIAEAVKNEAQ